MDYIDHDRVTPKGSIASINGTTVTFQDATSVQVDAVIVCSGYITEFSFLPPDFRHVPPSGNYKFVFNTTDVSLAYIGFVRPIVGSIPTLSELQARWVMKVWTKKIPIVCQSEREAAVEKDRLFWSEYFQGTSKRVQSLVEAYTYGDDVAKLSKVYPDYWALFKRNPRGFLTAYFAPYNGCSFRLNEADQERSALETLRRQSGNTITPLQLILLAFLRLIWFDWLLDKISVLKYHCQKNRFWKKIRNYRVIKAVDGIWTWPKRYLFDNKTKHCD